MKFEDIDGSLKKSERISNLQNIIWGDLGSSEPTDFLEMQKNLKTKKDALDEYWDLCEGDKYIATLMQKYKLSRKDLNEIYLKLIDVGVGQWVNGHFVALSTFAYSEPFFYLMESKERRRWEGEEFKKVAVDLLYYFREEIPDGGLYKRYGLDGSSSENKENSYIFCGYCGNKNKSEFSYCTSCGESLVQATTNEEIKREPVSTKATQVKSKDITETTRTYSPLRSSIKNLTGLILISSGLVYWGMLSGNIRSEASLGTLMQLVAASAPTTLLFWVLIISLSKSLITGRKDSSRVIVYGFLGIISLWGGVWWTSFIESEIFPSSPEELIAVAILLSPIWFIIGLLGSLFVKPKKEPKKPPSRFLSAIAEACVFLTAILFGLGIVGFILFYLFD